MERTCEPQGGFTGRRASIGAVARSFRSMSVAAGRCLRRKVRPPSCPPPFRPPRERAPRQRRRLLPTRRQQSPTRLLDLGSIGPRPQRELTRLDHNLWGRGLLQTGGYGFVERRCVPLGQLRSAQLATTGTHSQTKPRLDCSRLNAVQARSLWLRDTRNRAQRGDASSTLVRRIRGSGTRASALHDAVAVVRLHEIARESGPKHGDG